MNDQQRRVDIIEDGLEFVRRESASLSERTTRDEVRAVATDKMMTVVATANLNCNEARNARSAVLGPYTTEDGPCPKGTRPNDASGMKISTSKHTVLRELTEKIIRSKVGGRQHTAINLFRFHHPDQIALAVRYRKRCLQLRRRATD